MLPPEDTALVHLQNICKTYPLRKKTLQALVEVNISIRQGETVGLVGESGCGKSTLGRIALGLEKPTKGGVFFQGQNLAELRPAAMRPLRQKMQLIFQDPYASLNPRMTIEEIIGEGLHIHRMGTLEERRQKIRNLLKGIALDESCLQRYPHEFSGGQRQRIGIARALAVDPLFVVCDEPLSALDACTQRQVLQLLQDLKHNSQLTYLFISHDLHAMRQIADRIAVMYLGHVVEEAPAEKIFMSPQHPYTKALLASIPVPDPFIEKKRPRLLLQGEPPSPLNPPKGCPFHPRCPLAMPKCKDTPPPLLTIGPGHKVACHAVTP